MKLKKILGRGAGQDVRALESRKKDLGRARRSVGECRPCKK